MNWTEIEKGNKIIPYDHTTCDTPLGMFIITWKSWKETPAFSLEIEGQYISTERTIDDAKTYAEHYLNKKSSELNRYLNRCKPCSPSTKQ